MNAVASIGSRETVADALAGMSQDHENWLKLMMDNPAGDDVLLDGIHLYLDNASGARFLNTLKLQQCGQWLGNITPGRLQIRLMEAARSSQHPAYTAFREGLQKSGGVDKAYPKAKV
ncbi:hypothetical protein ACFSE1_01610 [Rhizobium helianthi]|uniref:Uncharacterized protein n=1 Tax=Rhizobium helianthi TaxID=1132695 RepID=A0ABW4LYL8_9HYPH